MAKKTTDHYKLEITWENAATKAEHYLKHIRHPVGNTATSASFASCNSDKLNDSYNLNLAFGDIANKFSHLFYRGQYVSKIDHIIYTQTSDGLKENFEIKIEYAGKFKKFEKIMEKRGYSYEVAANLISSSTKNLGVISPYNAQLTNSQEQVLDIIKLLAEDALAKAEIDKSATLARKNKKSSYYISKIGGGQYHSEWSTKLICVDLNNYKIGITNADDQFNSVKIVISKEDPNYPNYFKTQTLTLKSFPDRVVKKRHNYPYGGYHEMFEYAKYPLSDPNIGDKLKDMFKEIASK